MRIILGYPALKGMRGFLQVSQNRQSKLFSVGEEAAIFPCVMAWAATLLKQAGHEVIWQDGPAERLTWDSQFQNLQQLRPNLVCWEVKTPSAKRVYIAVNTLKQAFPDTIIVLVGDHITALPQEALEACSVDFVLRGGDYDFGLLGLVEYLQTGEITSSHTPIVGSRPAHYDLLETREDLPGTPAILTQTGRLIPRASLRWPTDANLSSLPVIDRTLCKWKLYSRMGNYLMRPGTHGYSARDCWWRHEGGCTFCSWTNTFKNYRQLSVVQFMADVESAHALGAREYFDDAGTWAPPGKWFDSAVCSLAVFNRHRRYSYARMAIGCNDRPGARGPDAYRVMANAGFRFILYGLESANFDTLQRINKGQHAEDMKNAARWATESGLQPHLTVMFGYPWETKEDATRTVTLVRDLFNHGWANSMQATLLMPYPGTKLYSDAQTNGWLLTNDWNRYTMNECILKCPMTHAEVLEKIRECYKAAVTPRYILKKVLTVRTRDDLRFFWRGFKFWWGHLTDFKQRCRLYAISH